MINHNWIDGISVAITVCDTSGFILEMNDRALEINHRQGENLIGTNIIDCHPKAIQPKAKQFLDSGETHTNTFEQDGNLYISYFTPWHKNGIYSGLIELIIEIPPHEKHKFIKEAN